MQVRSPHWHIYSGPYLTLLPVDSNEPAWVLAHAKQEKKDNFLRARTELEERLKVIRQKEAKDKAQQEARPDIRAFKKMVCVAWPSVRLTGMLIRLQRKHAEVEIEDDDEEQFIPDDYDSDNEASGRKINTSGSDGLSSEVKEMMLK